jgi:glycosyltransferase involved in cell wall biosynthesis
VRGEHVLSRILWEQAALTLLARRAGVDLVHGLAFSLPLAHSGPTVVTILDMSFALFRQHHAAARRVYLSQVTRASARKATAIIAISENTKRDVCRLLGVAPGKVEVIPCGVGSEFQPVAAAVKREFRERRGLEPYILYLGTIEPRKNLVRLVQAYARMRCAGAPKLVIGGAPGWGYESVYGEVERLGLGDSVLFPGYVPPDEAPMWYAAAELFVYPSLYEGFGIPPLEAMASGTPVVAADSSSLPEVVSGAGVIVPPEDTQALTEAMATLLGDPTRRQELVALGLERARSYSWTHAAKATTALYSRCLA